MWPYLVMFLAALATDSIPIVGPPVWTVMVFMLVKFNLNPWLVLCAGVPGSVLGRYGLSLYITKFFGKVIRKEKSDEMKFVGSKLKGSLWKIWPFVLAYSLLPLSTTALFSAAGLAKIRPIQILPPFFVGKFISDGIMLISGRYAIHQAVNSVSGVFSWQGLTTLTAGILVIGLFLFLNWRLLIEERKLRLNFHIWR